MQRSNFFDVLFMNPWCLLKLTVSGIISTSVQLEHSFTCFAKLCPCEKVLTTYANNEGSDAVCTHNIWAASWENLFMLYVNNKGEGSACTSVQSDQRLCYSLLRLCNTSSFYIRNFKPLPSICGWTGWFESYLVGNSIDRFSHEEAHMELEEASEKELENWPHWIAAHARLKELLPADTKPPFLMRRIKYMTQNNLLFCHSAPYTHRIGGNLKLLRESTHAHQKQLNSIFDCKFSF